MSDTNTIIGTILGVMIALFGVFGALFMWYLNKIDSDMKSIGNRLDSEIKAIGTRMDMQAQRMDGHASRIDQLYQIIVNLLQKKP